MAGVVVLVPTFCLRAESGKRRDRTTVSIAVVWWLGTSAHKPPGVIAGELCPRMDCTSVTRLPAAIRADANEYRRPCGIVVGPHVPGVYANMERVQLVSDLGVILLVFAIGLEFRFSRLIRLAPTAGLVAVVQVVSMVWLGHLVGRLMGWTPWESLLTGAMVGFPGPSSWPRPSKR